ncbi:CLUMA_CG006661, isoform A [Clunio marinus]|uniref:CLUMA_CG006661, isoform A n=1 Tax=Clunio marinus TaxID=568069 RepID=A0A1J1HYI6_9DIPT|nr:CLUMA_CG006661, isoform A [Clunio marinus]
MNSNSCVDLTLQHTNKHKVDILIESYILKQTERSYIIESIDLMEVLHNARKNVALQITAL